MWCNRTLARVKETPRLRLRNLIRMLQSIVYREQLVKWSIVSISHCLPKLFQSLLISFFSRNTYISIMVGSQ